MTNKIDRRELLKLGAVGGTALAAGSTLFAQSEGGERSAPMTASVGRSLSASYIVAPGVISRYEQATGDITTSAPWAISYRAGTAIEHANELAVPSLSDLVAWAQSSEEERGRFRLSERLSLDDAIRLPIQGAGPTSNLLADVLSIVLANENLDLTLDFISPPTDIRPRRLNTSGALPVIEVTPEEAGRESGLSERATYQVQAGDWRLRFMGVERHSLGTCVRESVAHFNLHVFRRNKVRPNRFDEIKNFHIGTYRSGGSRCFVLWNNIKPAVVCWKKCAPRVNDLKEMLVWVLLAAAALAGVYLAASAAGAIAATAAALMFPVLIVL